MELEKIKDLKKTVSSSSTQSVDDSTIKHLSTEASAKEELNESTEREPEVWDLIIEPQTAWFDPALPLGPLKGMPSALNLLNI